MPLTCCINTTSQPCRYTVISHECDIAYTVYSGANKYLIHCRFFTCSHLQRMERSVIFIVSTPQLWETECIVRFRGQSMPNGWSVGLVIRGCGFESRLRQEVSTTEVKPLSKAPNPQLLPGRRSDGCPLLQVCVLGWVKCREHISLLVILCIIVYVTNKPHLTLILSYFGHILYWPSFPQ